MIKYTFLYAIALILLGIGAYVLTGQESITALIPAFFGVIFAGIGVASFKADYHKHAMHAASALALLAILGSVGGAISFPGYLIGRELERPQAAFVQMIMFLFSIIYLYFCVKSFIDARKKKKLEAKKAKS